MRNLLALLMLIVLSLSGAAPACAMPQPAPAAMGHGMPMPGRCEDKAVHAGCIGCGVALPEALRVIAAVIAPAALPPVARIAMIPVGAGPQLPLPPPKG